MWPRFFFFCVLLSCNVAAGMAGRSLVQNQPIRGDEGEILEKVLASAGETVILPCSRPLSNDLPTVEWSKPGLNPDIVFVYRGGCEIFEMKNPIFWHRTNLIMNKLREGNLSLIIFNVELNDAGKYQCMIISNKRRHIVKTLELIVGAVSEPRLSVVPDVSDEVTLQCETNCWFPAPEVKFVDAQGNGINPENSKRYQDSSGCFFVTGRVTVKSPTNRITCRVHQPQINKTRDTHINIPADCTTSCSVSISITAVVAILLSGSCAGFCFCKKCYCEGRKINQSDTNNATMELVTKNQELKSEVCAKDVTIHQLREELNRLRSIQRPVLQTDQPTIDCSLSQSSLDILKPVKHHLHQFPHDGSPNSLNNKHMKSGNSPKSKASKHDVSRQNPVQASNQSDTSLPVFTNNGSLFSTSASASTSEEKPLVRSRSLSEPYSHGAKFQRRHTTSAPCSNRFSILADLKEDSEMLLSGEQNSQSYKL